MTTRDGNPPRHCVAAQATTPGAASRATNRSFYMASRDDSDSPPDATMGIARIVERLGMIEHPEGGYFVETYRAGAASRLRAK